MPRDYYEVLGIERNASQEEIQKAFRRQARKFHPDVNKEADAQAKFQEVNEAYQVLSDASKRASYDRFGHAGVNFGGAGGGFSDFSDFGSIEDIFEEFIGGFAGRRGARGRRRARQGRDLRYDLRLTFEEAFSGTERDIEVTRLESCDVCSGSGAEPGSAPITCPTCNGTGHVRQTRQTFLGSMVTVTDCASCRGSGSIVETPCDNCEGSGKVNNTRTLTVHVPAGVDDGTQIRLGGEGEPGEKSGVNGNLYVVLSVEPHEFFQRDGNNILLEININIAQAALGETIIVPTVEGEETTRIEAGTQSGELLRLKGKGFPKLNPDGRTQGRGDQICIVNVNVPKRLSTEQRELFEQLGKTLDSDVLTTPGQKGGLFNRFFGSS